MTTITPPLHSQLVKATCFLLMLLPLVDMIDEQHGRMASGGRKGRAILLDTGQVVEQKMVGNNGTTTAGFGGDAVIPGSTVGTFLGGGGGGQSGAANGWQKLFPTLTVHGGPSPSLFPSAGSSSPSASAFLSQSTYPYSGETTRGGGGSFSSSSSSSSSLTSFLPTSNSKRHRHAPPPPPTSLLMTTVDSATAAVASLSSSPHSSAATMQQQHQQQQQRQSFHFNNDNDDERVDSNDNNNANRAKERKMSTHHHQKSPLLAVDPPVSLAVSSSSSSSSSSRNSGPYFESNKTTIHVSAREGQTVTLDCAVALLQGRTVSWLRRRKDSLQLLTVGNTTYQKDSRLGLKFRYPNNWRLGIDSVSKADEGEYQCQLSTHPVIKTLIYHLKVIAPAVIILDENGQTKTERHYKVDSSLHLTCKASHVDKGTENKVTWLKGGRALPLSDKRIKVRFEKNPLNGDVSAYLSVSSVHKGDSGNYSCRASSQATSTIVVHVLNGELPAAVQHESCANNRLPLSSGLLLTLASALTMMMMMPTTSCASILLLLSERFTSSR